MTLRNEIEQAIDDFAREYKNLSPSSDAWEQYRAMTDRAVTKVCDLISKMAEGMPDAVDAEVDYLAGYTDCRNDCQTYLRKQVSDD